MFSLAATSPRTFARPGELLDWYPETLVRRADFLQRQFAQAACGVRARATSFSRFRGTAEAIERAMAEHRGREEPAYRDEAKRLRAGFRAQGLARDDLVRAFALAGTAVERELGFQVHAEQFFCAHILLKGMLAEMATGEGKTVAAALAAIVAALAGTSVHVITANDYLVARDATSMRPIFARFGLSSAFISAQQNDDARRAAYAASICYVSGKQLVFDYLRDRLAIGGRPSSLSGRVQELHRADVPRPLLRGLCFGIVDEADSVLIDDATTPLILSKQMHADTDVVQSLTAINLAKRLESTSDFSVDTRARRVLITEQGEHRLAALASNLDDVWKNRRFRLERVRQALCAIHLFHRDREYVVQRGRIVLLDQSTGRLMPDRKLQHGLHQMVETKEQCELSGLTETIASLSFQNFFKRYKHLCGMTGTAREAAGELRSVYGLGVVAVPVHRPSARTTAPARFALDEEEHKRSLLAEIQDCLARGRPVLVGTRSLAASERLSAFLKTAGLPHRVLNARQDKHEAEIVAKAGQTGAITIATNIAGRGTDIPIDDEARKAGGLQVIVAELNDNARIDRQLIGRGARQGDPGSCVHVICASDEMLRRHAPSLLLNMLRTKFVRQLPCWRWLYRCACRLAQAAHERRQLRARKQVAMSDEHFHRTLSFAGYKE